jgi:hypothetical protein
MAYEIELGRKGAPPAAGRQKGGRKKDLGVWYKEEQRKR